MEGVSRALLLILLVMGMIAGTLPIVRVGALSVISYNISGGRYYAPINISSSASVTGYSLEIVLNASNFAYWDHFNSTDGSDIYFLDSSGNPLYYWVEKFDAANKVAKIWVKVNLTTGTSTIYMYYGGVNPYSGYNDPGKVFVFWDDFEAWTGWTQYGSGVVSQSSDQAHHGSYSLKKDSYGDPNGGYRALGFTLNYPFVLEAWVKRTYLSGANADRFGVIDDTGSGYGIQVDHTNDQLKLDIRSSYTVSTPSSAVKQLSSDPVNTWYFAQMIWNNSVIVLKVYDSSGNLLASLSYTDSSYTNFTRVYVFGGYTYYVDELRIRKYVYPAPQVRVGAEASLFVETRLSVSPLYAEIFKGDSIEFKGKLVDVNGTGIASAEIEIYVNGTLVDVQITDVNGSFVWTYTFNEYGLTRITFRYAGSDVYDPAENVSYINAVSEAGHEVPSWVVSRQQLSWKGYSSDGSFDGHAEIRWELRDWKAKINGTSIELDGILKAENWEGIVTYAPNLPLIYARFRFFGKMSWEAVVEDTNGNNHTLGDSYYATFRHTILSVYHRGSGDSLWAVLQISYIKGAYYTAEIKWYRKVFDESTGNWTITELSRVSTHGFIDMPEPLVVEIWFRPEFYTITIDNQTYLIFGFKGSARFSCAGGGCAADTGRFEFAWKTKRIGPAQNISEADVARFIDDLNGWYVWIGAGLEYYEPYNSVVEILPHWDENTSYQYLTGIAVSGFTPARVVSMKLDYRLWLDIDQYYAENWIANPSILYALFKSGSLEAYEGAYFSVRDRGVSGWGYLVMSLLPIGFAALIWGAFWRNRWAGYVFFATALATGAGMGIYGVPEIAGGILAFAAAYYLHGRGGGEAEAEQ